MPLRLCCEVYFSVFPPWPSACRDRAESHESLPRPPRSPAPGAAVPRARGPPQLSSQPLPRLGDRRAPTPGGSRALSTGTPADPPALCGGRGREPQPRHTHPFPPDSQEASQGAQRSPQTAAARSRPPTATLAQPAFETRSPLRCGSPGRARTAPPTLAAGSQSRPTRRAFCAPIGGAPSHPGAPPPGCPRPGKGTGVAEALPGRERQVPLGRAAASPGAFVRAEEAGRAPVLPLPAVLGAAALPGPAEADQPPPPVKNSSWCISSHTCVRRTYFSLLLYQRTSCTEPVWQYFLTPVSGNWVFRASCFKEPGGKTKPNKKLKD